MRAIVCPTCGAPLAPAPEAVRTRCQHCGGAVDVVSEDVARVAGALQRAGIRVPAKLMTVDEVSAEIAERAAADQKKRRREILLTGIGLGAAMLVLVLVIVLSR